MNDGQFRMFPDRDRSDRFCLLLFFLAGALLARMAPALAERIPAAPRLLPVLLLLPALLGGCVFGGCTIPLVTMLFGVLALRAMSGIGMPELRSPAVWSAVLLPMLAAAPLLFVLAESGMNAADAALAQMKSGNSAACRSVLRRQTLHLAAACASLLFRYWLL